MGWMASATNGHEFEQALGDGDDQEGVPQSMGSQPDPTEQRNDKPSVCPRDNIPVPQHVRKTCRDLAHIPLQPRASAPSLSHTLQPCRALFT